MILAKKQGRKKSSEGLTLSVNVLNFFQYRSCALGKEQARWIIRGFWEENRSHPRHRNTEEHEKLKKERSQIRRLSSNEATYLMEETNVLECEACWEQKRENRITLVLRR
jgi:hypothetical protein